MNLFDGAALNPGIASLPRIALGIVAAFLLGLLVSWVYRVTCKGGAYSSSFIQTLLFLAMITALVIMVIGSSVALAFSLVGALSIIRFRTPVKNARDTTFVFFALAVGMACGTGAFAIGALGSVVICLLMLATHKLRIGDPPGGDFLLKLRVKGPQDAGSVYQSIFQKHLKRSTLVHMTSAEQGDSVDLAFRLSLKQPPAQSEFLSELSAQPGITQVMMVAQGEPAE